MEMSSASSPQCTKSFATYTLVINCGIFALKSTSGAPLPLSTTPSTDYSEQLIATGGLLPYIFTLTAGTLPGNMTLSSTGLLKGMPTSLVSSTPLTITLQDYNGCAFPVDTEFSVACGTYDLPDSLPQADTSSSYDVLLVAPGITPGALERLLF